MTPFGLDRNAAGSGTTPADMQVIIRSSYASCGALSGLETLASSGGLSWTVQPGAAVIPVSGTGAVIAAYDTPTTLSLPTNNTGGARTATIYAACPNVAGGQAVLGIAYGTPAPTHEGAQIPYVVLDAWSVPAGAVRASDCVPLAAREYAVPVGVGQSRIADIKPAPAYSSPFPQERTVFGRASIYLPQDRLLRIYITQSLASIPGESAGAVQWIISDSLEGQLDGGTPVLDYPANPASGLFGGGLAQYTVCQSFRAGWHTLTVETQQITGGIPLNVGGQGDNNVLRPYSRVEVFDVGIHA